MAPFTSHVLAQLNHNKLNMFNIKGSDSEEDQEDDEGDENADENNNDNEDNDKP